MSQVIHGNGVHHIHSHSNDQNWTYVPSISLSLSPGVSQTTLLPSALGTSGSEVHVFVFALYFLNKSWGPVQLGFDIVSLQINTMRQQTPILFSSSSSIFIECQRGGILLFFKMCPQNALSSLFLWISSTQKTFSEILLIWNLPASKVPCHPVHGLYHLPRFGYVIHQPGLPHFLSILSACQGKLLADLVKKESCPQRKSWQW